MAHVKPPNFLLIQKYVITIKPLSKYKSIKIIHKTSHNFYYFENCTNTCKNISQ